MSPPEAPCRYAMQKQVDRAFEAAVADITERLSAQGFGVLMQIDVQGTLKAKLDVDVPAQVILGACNPNLAHQALGHEPDVALLLPCNVVVRQTDAGVLISAVDPAVMLGVTENPALHDVSAEARRRLRAAIDGV